LELKLQAQGSVSDFLKPVLERRVGENAISGNWRSPAYCEGEGSQSYKACSTWSCESSVFSYCFDECKGGVLTIDYLILE